MAISRIVAVVAAGALSYAYGSIVFLRWFASDGLNFSVAGIKGLSPAMAAVLLVYGVSAVLAMNYVAARLLKPLARHGMPTSPVGLARMVNWSGLASLGAEVRKEIVWATHLASRDCVRVFTMAGIIAALGVYQILRSHGSLSEIAAIKSQVTAVIVLAAMAYLWAHCMSAGFIASGNAFFSETDMRKLLWDARTAQQERP